MFVNLLFLDIKYINTTLKRINIKLAKNGFIYIFNINSPCINIKIITRTLEKDEKFKSLIAVIIVIAKSKRRKTLRSIYKSIFITVNIIKYDYVYILSNKIHKKKILIFL